MQEDDISHFYPRHPSSHNTEINEPKPLEEKKKVMAFITTSHCKQSCQEYRVDA